MASPSALPYEGNQDQICFFLLPFLFWHVKPVFPCECNAYTFLRKMGNILSTKGTFEVQNVCDRLHTSIRCNIVFGRPNNATAIQFGLFKPGEFPADTDIAGPGVQNPRLCDYIDYTAKRTQVLWAFGAMSILTLLGCIVRLFAIFGIFL